MPAALQQVLALAFVVLVAGVALSRRLRLGTAASCHGCSGSCSPAAGRPSDEPLVPIRSRN